MIIYLIINLINLKIYVGQTTDTLCNRRSGHLCSSRGTDIDMPIDWAIKKYGEIYFTFTEICSAETQEELDFLEVLFIQALNARDPNIGYNLREGGKGGKNNL